MLEVLTAAVEYGLEELREVGLCGRALFCFPCLYALSAYPASHTVLERNMYQYRTNMDIYVIGIYVNLCAKGYVYALCVLWAHMECLWLVL